MRRYLKLAGTFCKYAGLLFGGTALFGLGYLQYVNSQVGPIEIDKEAFVRYYINEAKMEPKQANQMYYWVLCDIAFMRVMTYLNYSSYCEKLRRRILTPSLTNYQQNGLYSKIERNQQKVDSKAGKALFKEVTGVRQKNMNGIIENEFIIKQIRRQQKLMDTRRILGVDKETLDKLTTIHSYICETGKALKDAEVVQYLQSVPQLQRRLPGDIIHKIMFI